MLSRVVVAMRVVSKVEQSLKVVIGLSCKLCFCCCLIPDLDAVECFLAVEYVVLEKRVKRSFMFSRET